MHILMIFQLIMRDFTFNIVDLVTYKSPTVTQYDTFHELPHDSAINPMTYPTPPSLLLLGEEYIDAILDEHIILTEMEKFSAI